jgi:hypothetical protein
MASACIKITKKDGSILEFRKEKVEARWNREFLLHQAEVSELIEKGELVKVLDSRVDFLIRFFGDKKLTVDLILDNVECDELNPLLETVVDTLNGTGTKEGK